MTVIVVVDANCAISIGQARMDHRVRYWLKEAVFSLQQIKKELPALRSKTAIYFPDFNLVHPYVYSQSEARYRLTDSLGRCLFTLLSAVSMPPKICISISLPTMMEFLFSIQRHYRLFDCDTKDDELSSYIFRCLQHLKEGKITIRDIKSERIKRFIISENDLGGIDHRVGNFIKMFRKEKIDLLTDHYSSNQINKLLSENYKLLERINDTIKEARQQRDQRSTLNKSLSYKVDAHNVFLPILNTLSDERTTSFVCSNDFSRWAPTGVLQSHQRSPLFLIMLVGTIGDLPQALSFDQKLDQIGNFVDNSLEEGIALVRTSNEDAFSLDSERRARAYLQTHLEHYINMSKTGPLADEEPTQASLTGVASYKDYLEIGRMRQEKLNGKIRTLHDLVDDSTDDMYRDFVDDFRFRKAFPSLKLG